MVTLQDVIRRITIQASAQGADAATASLQKLATAQGAVAVATTTTDKATLSAQTRLNSLQRTVDTTYASELKMAQVEKTLTAARNEGLIGLERENELLSLATAKYTEAGAAAELMAKGEEIAGEAAKGLLASLGPLLALTALAELPSKIMETVESVSNIGENAEVIGTTAKNLQELDFAATQYGVSADVMNSALERFTKNIGVAQTGTGELAKILKANGIGITGNTVTDLENYANLIERATTAEQRNFLTTTAFGKGSVDLGNLFRDGADGIQEMIDKADAANVVLSDGTVESAHQLNQEFQSLETQLNATFEEFIINIAPTLEATLQTLTNVVRAANAVIDVGKVAWNTAQNADLPIEQQSTDYLNQRIQTLQTLLTATQDPNSLQGDFERGRDGTGATRIQQELSADQGEVAKRGATDLNTFVAGNDGLNGGWGTLPAATKLPTTATTGGGAKALDPYQQAMQSAKAETANLIAQQQALGLTAEAADKLTEQQKLLNEATKKGTDLSPDQLTAIGAAATEYAKEKANLAALNELYADGKQDTEDFFSTLKTSLENGESVWQSFGDAAGKVLDDIANKALSFAADGIWNSLFSGLEGSTGGSGGLGSFLSSIFHFAGGTSSAPGGLSLVGEDGPEIVNVPRGAQVYPAPITRSMMAGSAGGGTANVIIQMGDTHISGTGLSAQELAQVLAAHTQQMIDGLNKQIVPVVQKIVGLPKSMAGQSGTHFRTT